MVILFLFVSVVLFVLADLAVRSITQKVSEKNKRREREEALAVSLRLDVSREAKTLKRAEIKDPVFAFTAGAVREMLDISGFRGGIGADVTFCGVPDSLQPAYGSYPVSFHVFFRLQLPTGPMGRMWNMRMSQPMAGHRM